MADQVQIANAILCLKTILVDVFDSDDNALNVNVVSSGGLSGNQTAARTRVTANGSVTDDTYGSVTFFSPLTNTDAPTVAGVTLEVGRSLSFNADPGRGLNAIAYTASATATLEINTITK